MLTSLSVTDDISDGSGKEYDDCDLNSDGDCADTGETAAGSGYLLQGMWNAGTATYDWSVPSGTSCDTGYRACVSMKLGEEKYTLNLISEGRSDDDTAERVVKQKLRYANPFGLAGPPTHPLITYSKVSVSGSMSVVNLYSNATIWSGGNVTGFGNGASGTRGTLIHPNPDGAQVYEDSDGNLIPFFDPGISGQSDYDGDGEYDAGEKLLDITNTNKPYDSSKVTKSSGGDGSSTYIGPDVIDNSSALAKSKTKVNPDGSVEANPDGFFTNFFTGGPEFIKLSSDYIVDPLDSGADSLVDADGVNSVDGSMIWVDARDEATDTLGSFSLKNGTYGSPDEPIILVIDGDLDLKAAPTIYGVLYVRGDVVGGGSGGGLIFGSAIIEGDNGVDGSGGFDVIYDPNILSAAGGGDGRNSVAGIPGTWRDW
jgi:hypothetical protein